MFKKKVRRFFCLVRCYVKFRLLLKKIQQTRILILEEYPGEIGTKKITAEGEQKKKEEKEKAPKIGIKKYERYYVFKDRNFKVDKFDRNLEWCT